MNSVYRILFTLIAVLVITARADAGNYARDSWFGKDKLIHFTYSAFLAGDTYVIAKRHFNNTRNNSFIISVGFTVSIGGIKEIIDYRKPGQSSSYKDFIWDIAGAILGSSIASKAL